MAGEQWGGGIREENGKNKRRYGERKRDENNNERVRENMGGGEIEKERQTYRGRVSIGEGAERKQDYFHTV